MTRSIHQLAELALSKKDFPAFQFLQWFVSEQVEEEGLFGQVLGMIRQAGTSPVFMLDRAIGQIKGK